MDRKPKPGWKLWHPPEQPTQTTWMPEWTGFQGKTLWDWLQLLIVPLVIAWFGLSWTTTWQNAREQEMAQRQAQQQHEIEAQRAQDAALQTYLEVMKSLLLDEGLKSAGPDSSARAVAQAETIAVFSRLDPRRKALALQFLYESSLIQKDRPIVDLKDVSLEDINLRNIDLSGAGLSGANLGGANPSGANLSGADLSGALLSESPDEYFGDVILTDADLSGADPTAATITEEQLAQCASLDGATMPNGQKYEEWLKSKGREEDGENSTPS